MAYNDRITIKPQSGVGQVNTFATQVYGWMTAGLALTAFVAWFIYKTGLYHAVLPFWWITAIGTFAIAMTISSRLNQISFSGLATLFLAYSALEGVFFGSVLPGFAAAFGGQIIWTAFGSASLIFAIAVAYGVFTKSDMTSLGRILSIGVIGLVAVTLLYMVLSLFMPMTGMMLIISYLGLMIFVGLTAYDANQIRKMSSQVDGYSVMSCKLSLIMALRMYINVIMVFWYLLQIFSSSSRR
ncbi:MAG: Inner membrane protein YbhL [Chlamydiae bacterium]|nr:Inner membrane protein YbhL [Chlamydiota bacterium]